LINKLNSLLAKSKITEEDNIEIKRLKLELDQIFLGLAKWLEEGERNSSYLFALEKRNGQRKTLSALNIDGDISKNQKWISDFVAKFYSDLYTSNFNYNNSEKFIDLVKNNIKVIDLEYSQICDSPLSIEEIKQALHKMKKGKYPGIDGLSVEFYHFLGVY